MAESEEEHKKLEEKISELEKKVSEPQKPPPEEEKKKEDDKGKEQLAKIVEERRQVFTFFIEHPQVLGIIIVLFLAVIALTIILLFGQSLFSTPKPNETITTTITTSVPIQNPTSLPTIPQTNQ